MFYIIAEKGADSVVNIAKEINQSHVSVSKILKEMEAADLIKSFKSAQDSRITLIELNTKARAMVPNMLARCDPIDQAMVQLKRETGGDLWQDFSFAY